MQRVVVLGGGFADLEAARYLSRRAVEVVVVDRRNHHLFQPLLYQAATAVLAPEEVATPIRSALARRVDVGRQVVRLRSGDLAYDRLILAPGSRTAYFGHDDWAEHAIGLKDLDDALAIRGRVLAAFERAEQARTPEERWALLTFAVIGGGPTGA